MNTLFAVLLLAACATMMASAHDADCDVMHRLVVKQRWAAVFSTGAARIQFGTKLWREVFRRQPSMRDLFDNVNGNDIMSAKFTAHAQRVLGGLDMCIALLDEEDTLNAELAHLKMQHDARGIGAENFDVLGDALIYILPDLMETKYHDGNAWTACFDVIKKGITG